MPNINIKERDLTSPGIELDSSRIVYVPGYSDRGLTGTPTLCTTLAEFTEAFGNAYVFTAQESYPAPYTELSVEKGQSEPSYVYAYQLIDRGIPVLFERIAMTGTKAAWTITSATEDTKPKLCEAVAEGTWYNNLKISTTKSSNDIIVIIYETKNSTDTEIERILVKGADFSTAYSKYVVFNPEATAYYKSTGAQELTKTGPSTSASVVSFTVSGMYTALATSTFFDKLADKNKYSIAYITTGAYPVIGYSENTIATNMITAASLRGDCTALVDTLDDVNAVRTWARNLGNNTADEQKAAYGACFVPFGTYEFADAVRYDMPGSFGYLMAMANSVDTNPEWLAIAGVNRGIIKELVGLKQSYTDAQVNQLQPRNDIAVNPIIYLNAYKSYAIWGNRTLLDNAKKGDLVAQSFLNIRQLCSTLKKELYNQARKTTFEQNSDVVWLNFKAAIVSVLDKMQSGNGIYSYQINRKATTKKATLAAVVRIYPIEALEDFDITVELADDTVSVIE